MEFEWDDAKNRINLAKHGVDFADAVHVFIDDSRIERRDVRFVYGGEERWQTVGITAKGILFVVYTERNARQVVRLISARKANKRERITYAKGQFEPYTKEG